MLNIYQKLGKKRLKNIYKSDKYFDWKKYFEIYIINCKTFKGYFKILIDCNNN